MSRVPDRLTAALSDRYRLERELGAGGMEPVWARSGKELFFRSTSGGVPQQMAMGVLAGETFTPGERRTLFPSTRFVVSSSHRQYAVAPGDQRFVMIRLTGSKRADQLVVVENFFEVLRARWTPAEGDILLLFGRRC